MAIKKQKRSLEEAVPAQQNGAQNKKLNDKSKKIKMDKRPTPQNAEASQIKKAKKSVAPDGPEKIVEINAVVQKTEERDAKKAAKLLKKNENRKEARKEHGQFKPENVTLSVEEINKRIALIQARSELTKSAKRKLGVLKKKLSIIEGTFVSNPKPVYASPELAKKARRDRRKERIAQKKALLASAEGTATDATPKAKILGKPREGVAGQTKKGAEKKKKTEAKKIVIEKAEPEESDEDENEEEGEEDSDEKMDDSEENLNESEEQSEEDDDDDDEEEDDDDDDDEDDEEEEDEEESKPPAPKKKVVKAIVKDSKKESAKPSPQKQQVSNGDGLTKKFVLFVRNIPFDSSPDDIKKHFLTKVGGVVGVRIPNKPGTTTSRGLAFVEFSNETDYQKGLSLHNTMVNGRRINVEYTQGGSKSVGKRPEVAGKNKNLHAMRKGGGMQGGKRDVRNDRQKKRKST